MIIKYETRHSAARVPFKATVGAAGFDLTAVTIEYCYSYTEYDTGIAVAIPEGYVGLVFPRSSISKKYQMSLANSVGVIDSDYRGTIKLRFREPADGYEVGDRIGQLVIVPIPQVTFEEGYLDETNRGHGGFGSTNKE